MDYFDLVQWPAMMLTVLAAWLVGSRSSTKRNLGFWIFLASNAAWIVWGWYVRAHALIVLQLCLAVLNVRGVQKNDSIAGADDRSSSSTI